MEEVLPERCKQLDAKFLPSDKRGAHAINDSHSNFGYYKAEHAELVMIDFLKENR